MLKNLPYLDCEHLMLKSLSYLDCENLMLKSLPCFNAKDLCLNQHFTTNFATTVMVFRALAWSCALPETSICKCKKHNSEERMQTTNCISEYGLART